MPKTSAVPVEHSPATAADDQCVLECEFVLVKGGDIAVGIGYRPGEIPRVSFAKLGSAARRAISEAQKKKIPLFDYPDLTPKLVKNFQAGEEIPQPLYRAVAQTVASIQKSPSSLQRVIYRTVKEPSGQTAVALASESEKVEVRVGSKVELSVLGPLLEVHREKIQMETGLPLAPMLAKSDPTVAELNYELRVLGDLVAGGSLERPEAVDPILSGLYASIAHHGWRLLGYPETELLVETVRKKSKVLVQELIGTRLSLGQLRLVLRNLLRESISIRDLLSIMERLTEIPPQVQDPDEMTEYVRGSLAYSLSRRYSDDYGVLYALLMEPLVEQRLFDHLRGGPSVLWMDLDVDTSLNLLRSVQRGLDKAKEQNLSPVVICSPRPRRFLRRLLENSYPFLPVLSYAEIAPYTDLRILGNLSL